jgi:diguanylate cyclase (GGDEF)-like protein
MHRLGARRAGTIAWIGSIAVLVLLAGAAGAGSLIAADDGSHGRTAALIGIPVVFVLGGILLAFLWRVGQRARHEESTRVAERSVREREALVDPQTGARNLRAFRDDLPGALDRHSRTGEPVTLVMLEVQGAEPGDDAFTEFARAADRAIRSKDGLYRIGRREFALILAAMGRWGALGVVQRLHFELGRRRFSQQVSAIAGIAEAERQQPLRTLLRNADAALLAAKHEERGVAIYSHELDGGSRQVHIAHDAHYRRTLATALARAVDAKDSYTRSHSETVSALCGMIGAELELSPERLDQLKLAGLLHDVGKIGIADAILQKPGPLTDDEFEVMKKHSTIGESIVESAELGKHARWVRHHHERVDGSGYPDALADKQIPLESRVILVADAFEAMTSDRPYRMARPPEEAIAELERGAGTQFDPECVAALRRALDRDSLDSAAVAERPREAERGIITRS